MIEISRNDGLMRGGRSPPIDFPAQYSDTIRHLVLFPSAMSILDSLRFAQRDVKEERPAIRRIDESLASLR